MVGGGEDGRRQLPSVDALLRRAQAEGLLSGVPPALAVQLARQAIEQLRRRLADDQPASQPRGGPGPRGPAGPAEQALRCLGELAGMYRRRRLQPVINATGVILHTNLGRAPLPQPAVEAAARAASGYSNLELDLETGRRGRREERLEELLSALTGAEAAFVVNNNAAAVLLVLSATCSGREVIISRGELIEIGGEFRLPDVMMQSGCRLVEVGTTNRTRRSDYERAIGPHTAAILKAHTSNYRIVGFTESVPPAELAELAHRHGLLMLEDLGSGCLVDTRRYGLAPEPTVAQAVAAGVDAVTFSGDKLLGGPQAGIVVGRREVVERVRRHPLARAVRLDKMTVAALEAVLELYARGALEELPVWAALACPLARLEDRARELAQRLRAMAPQLSPGGAWRLDVVPAASTVGGGSLPGEVLESRALRLTPARPGASLERLARALRTGRPPVVGRVEEGGLLLDLRTVLPEQDPQLAEAVCRALGEVEEAEA